MKAKIKNYIRVRLAFIKNIIPQTCRYFKAYFSSVSYNQVLMRDILLLSHALEKGLIYSNPKQGWGDKKAKDLLRIISYLLSVGESPNEYEIQEACGVLLAFSEAKGSKCDNLQKEVKILIDKFAISPIIGGGKKLSIEKLFSNESSIDFLMSRRSTRFFLNEIVPYDVVSEAITIANTAPSACNKQPSRVYCPFDKDAIESVADYFKKAYVFENIPQILIITSKLSVFSSDEYLQPLINGGMYAEALCLAFHALGIGSCPLEMVAFKNPEKKIRKLCSIPDDEVIVTAIAFGKVKNINNCTCGARRSSGQVLKEI